MKKLFLILIIMLILFVGCNTNNDTANNSVAITTDRSMYTPAMSSAQGITMTPKFKSDKKYIKLVYHWITNEGEFIGFGKDVENHGEAVTWSAISNNKVTEIKSSFDISLAVIDGKSQKILATTKISIEPDNGFYKVQK